jgi:hypothetical protein
MIIDPSHSYTMGMAGRKKIAGNPCAGSAGYL